MNKNSQHLKTMKDETLIQVTSALGVYCGEFVWPTNQLKMLEEINNSPYGFYFLKADAFTGQIIADITQPNKLT